MKLNLDSNSVSSIQLYDILFFVLGKICRGSFLEIFKGYLNFFDLKIALRYAQDNLGVKKVSALQKKSLEITYYSMLYVLPTKKKTSCTLRISGTLIVTVFVFVVSQNMVQTLI
jgi:hypothetical protein